jgi:peptide/nickel transport system permease protein
VLPAVALSFEPGIAVARQLRTALIDVYEQNYVTGAVVRGLSGRRILFVHALRNAAGPALTVLGVGIPTLVGGAVVTELVFSLPGLGQLVLNSATSRDVPVVQGVLLVTSTLVIATNLVVNALLGRLRPAERR